MAGAIWVVCESREDGPTRLSGQVLGAARKLAEEQALEVLAVSPGGDDAAARGLASSAHRVIRVPDAGMAAHQGAALLGALDELAGAQGRPRAVLAGASPAGLSLMPRLAARWRAGYLASCVDLWWQDDALAARHPVLGGRAYRELACPGATAVATVRAGAFQAADPLAAPGRVEAPVAAPAGAAAPEVIERQPTSSAGGDLNEAARVVAGGRGMGGPEDFRLVEELAAALDASVAASRSVVDAGWRPHDEQVGKSGKTISPELYVACGISGAVHHLMGMNTAKVVVAINTDPQAPVFQHADYGVVGDVHQVIPALIEALKTRTG